MKQSTTDRLYADDRAAFVAWAQKKYRSTAATLGGLCSASQRTPQEMYADWLTRQANSAATEMAADMQMRQRRQGAPKLRREASKLAGAITVATTAAAESASPAARAWRLHEITQELRAIGDDRTYPAPTIANAHLLGVVRADGPGFGRRGLQYECHPSYSRSGVTADTDPHYVWRDGGGEVDSRYLPQVAKDGRAEYVRAEREIAIQAYVVHVGQRLLPRVNGGDLRPLAIPATWRVVGGKLCRGDGATIALTAAGLAATRGRAKRLMAAFAAPASSIRRQRAIVRAMREHCPVGCVVRTPAPLLWWAGSSTADQRRAWTAQVCWEQIATGETYHPYVGDSLRDFLCVRFTGLALAASRAVAQFATRATAARQEDRNRQLDAMIATHAACIFVSVEDAIVAGNCEAGVRAAVPAIVAALDPAGEVGAVSLAHLLSVRQDLSARRAARVAAARYAHQHWA